MKLVFSALTIALGIVIFIALVVTSDAGAGRAQVKATICEVFGTRCGPALRVASCETGGTYNPYARGRAGERGLFQIHPVHFSWLDEARLWMPGYNSRIAFLLSRGGRDWSAWTCRP